MKDKFAIRVRSPQPALAEIMARKTFQVLLAAFSDPGRIFTLPGRPLSNRQCCQQIGFTLLHLRTSFYTPDFALAVALRQSGALSRTAANAAYLFFPDNRAPQLLESIEEAKAGAVTNPDEGATLIVACRLGKGPQLRLHDPNLMQALQLCVAGLPPQFWQLRTTKICYPAGVDLFLVDNSQVVGLPRTTTVEVI